MMYTVAQGDCLSSIAYEHGFADWQTIYNHDKNKAFRRQCPDPNIIYPGLDLFIPELTPKVESRGTGQLHVFRKKVTPVLLRIVLLDEEHRPMAGAAYQLKVAESSVEGAPAEWPPGADDSASRRYRAPERQGRPAGWRHGLHVGSAAGDARPADDDDRNPSAAE